MTATGVLVIVMAVGILSVASLGIPTEQVGGLIVSAVLPFNLAKGLLSAVITFIIYKRVRFFLVESVKESPVIRSIPKMPRS